MSGGVTGSAGLIWRWFRLGWRGHAPEMVWLLLGSALTALATAGFAWLWKVILDAAQAGSIGNAGLFCLGIGVGQSLFYIAVQGTRTRMNERIQQRARMRVLAHVARVDPGALARWRTGDLVTRLTDDVSTEKLAWFLCSGVFRAYEALLVVICSVVAMLLLDPGLTLLSLLPLPVLVALQVSSRGELRHRATRAQEELARTSSVIQDTFEGIRVVQARGLGALARRAFAEATSGQAAAEVSQARLVQWSSVQFGYGWQLAIAVLLFAGGTRVIDGTLGIGDFVAFNGLVVSLVVPMFDFAAFLVRWRQASASLVRLEELLALPQGTARTMRRDAGITLPARIGAATLPIDIGEPLVLAPGQMLAVTGPVGAGKSTLLRALAGQEAIRGDLPALAAAAWVPQEAAILSVPIDENILLGTTANVTDCVRAARLEPDLAKWPEGLRTPVGERGVTLSGGQQQRVQLARALASGRAVLLFDDATSALDADTEARFWDGLDRSGVIVVVVTHRPATLVRADLVLYLRGGVVEARGSHEALVATHAAYRAAYG